MSDIDDILAGLKTLMATVDASPQRNADYIYSWPADNDQITGILHQQGGAPLPVIVVSRDLAQSVQVQKYHLNAIKNVIPFEILIFLQDGPLTKIKQASEAVKVEPDWIPAVSKVLSANRSLSNSALTIGNDNGIFTYQSGHIHFAEPKIFWGIRFEVFAHQEIV